MTLNYGVRYDVEIPPKFYCTAGRRRRLALPAYNLLGLQKKGFETDKNNIPAAARRGVGSGRQR